MSKSKKSDEHPVQNFMGLPMRWDRKNVFKNLWNAKDDRVFPPNKNAETVLHWIKR